MKDWGVKMGTYLLKDNELEVKVVNPSWLMLLGHVILTVATIGLWSPILLYYILKRATTRYIITNHRIISEYGILNKNSKESPLDKVNNVSHSQSIFGRIFNYGSVQLQTASEMGATIFKFLPAPKQFKSEITNQVDLYKKMHIQEQASAMAQAMNQSKVEEHATVLSDSKECPMCAEPVKLAAKICRYCNHEFAEA